MRRVLLAAMLAIVALTPADAARRIPTDLSNVRGFNYTPAEANTHLAQWLNYDPAITARDLDYAKRLQLNQMRVMIPISAWADNKAAFHRALVDLVRAAHARGIGVMPTLQYPRDEMADEATWPKYRDAVADLIATIGKEPGLFAWDVQNEPDCCQLPDAVRANRVKHAVYMAKLFHELDRTTPVTIGFTYVPGMIEAGEAVDVLSFHDYSTTRAAIDAHIDAAKAYAAKVGKPLINSEIACVARANPYDIVLEEYAKAHVGWYIWELMIAPYWGNVHGVFYADGTVRDPSIPAAILGFYRNRGANTVAELPDRENHLTEAVVANRQWLATAHPDWSAGLDLAEVSAHLAESAQIIAMHDLPTRQIRLMRAAAPDLPALRALLTKLTAALEPYQLAPNDPRRSQAVNVAPPAKK